MKRILLLLLLAVAAWFAWHHWGDFLHRTPGDEAVIENTTGREMTHVRLVVDGQTLVKDSIPDGDKAELKFHVDHDSSFRLVWQWADVADEHSWVGGNAYRGPMLQRHFMTVDGDGAVVYRAESK